jgi:L-threonine-O-3-phosphate decarboxylase
LPFNLNGLLKKEWPMKFGHGGDIRGLARRAECNAQELLDFSANINPLGPPDCVQQVVSRHLSEVVNYPDPHCWDLRRAIAAAFSLPASAVVCGNGSTELLYAIPRALTVDRAVIPVPNYIDYAAATNQAGLDIATITMDAEEGFFLHWDRIEQELSGEDMVFLGQPGNPSGLMFDPKAMMAVAERNHSTVFIVDEAFADFIPNYQSLACYGLPNIIVLRTMTKFYAIPGLRLGFALAPQPLAERIAAILPPWSVGSLSQAVGVAVLEDIAYAEKTRKVVSQLREELYYGLVNLGAFAVFPSAANYLLCRIIHRHPDAVELARCLLTYRIAIRVCHNYEGLDDRYFRVAVRTARENEKLIRTLATCLDLTAKNKT